VVALVEPAQHRDFEQHANRRGGENPPPSPSQNEPDGRCDGGNQVGANHVQRTVGQVDHVHDAEHQRQPGGQQEQHQAELQAVEHLLKNQDARHGDCLTL
jgi:hypothetical protein